MIICLLIPLGAASASDINTTDDQVLSATPNVDTLSAGVNLEQDNNTLSVNEKNMLSAAADDNILGSDDEGSFTELGKLISSADQNLTLNKNYVFQNGDTAVNIRNNNIVIDFKDNTINASNHEGNVLTISGNNVTLKNLKITNINGLESNYGIIISGNDVVLENIKLYDSKSYFIEWNGDNGILTKANIKNIQGICFLMVYGDNFKFTYSNITKSSVVRTAVGQGFVGLYGFDNIFSHNRVDQLSGTSGQPYAFLISNTEFSYSNFTNCTHNILLSPMGDSNMHHLVFDNVVANNYRGILFSSSGSLNNNFNYITFKNCTAGNGERGEQFDAIFWMNNPSCSASHITFEDTHYKYQYDACLVLMGQTVRNITFKNNNITCIFTRGSSSLIENSIFINNTQSRTNRAVVYANQPLVIRNCTFENNTGKLGGAIYLGANKCSVEKCTFNSNTALNNMGDDIYVNGALNVKLNASNKWSVNYTDSVYAPNAYDSLLPEVWVIQDELVEENATGSKDSPLSLTDALNKVTLFGTIKFTNNNITYNNINKAISVPVNLLGNNITIISNKLIFYFNQKYFGLVVSDFNFINCSGRPITYRGFNFTVSNCNFINLTSDYAIVSEYNPGEVMTGSQNIINCNFTNCTPTNGGLVLLEITGDNVIRDCNFNNNTIKEGAIHLRGTGNNAKVMLLNCNFTDNTVTNNNLVRVNTNTMLNVSDCNFIRNTGSSGAAITTAYNSLFVNHTNFINNTGKTAGAICVRSNVESVTIDDCTFTDNRGINGSAIYTENLNCNIKDSRFIDNNATTGGAIYHEGNALTVIGSTFTGNNATTGGAIYGEKSNSKLSISDSIFTGNNATTSSGGAIYYNGDLSVENSKFTENYATLNGGAILSKNLVNIINSNFTSNTVAEGNGSAVNSEFLTITGGKVNKNNAVKGNGSLYLAGDESIISNVIFTHNSGSNGAAIFTKGNNTLIMTSTFTDNTVSGFGGAIYISDNCSYYIDTQSENTYNNNTASDLITKNIYNKLAHMMIGEVYVVLYPESIPHNNFTGDIDNPVSFSSGLGKVAPGGSVIFKNISEIHNSTPDFNSITFNKYGIKIIGNENTTLVNFTVNSNLNNIQLYNLTFTNTTTTVVIVGGNNWIIDNCKFINNGDRFLTNASAINVLGENLTVANSIFENNWVGDENTELGGCILINASGITIDNCTFDKNIANNGAHLFVCENVSGVTIKDSRFYNANKQNRNGVGLLFYNHEGISISGSNFTNNTGNGAVIFEGEVVALKIKNNRFINNTATDGGAINIKDNSLSSVVENTTFINNTATGDGGALFINSGDLSITSNNIFDGNSAVNGGAVYSNASLTIKDAEFKNNEVSNNGGALFIGSGLTNLDNVSFDRNTAGNAGGAIYIGNNARVNVNGDVSLSGNSAGSSHLDTCAVHVSGLFTVSGSVDRDDSQEIHFDSDAKTNILYVSPGGSGDGFTMKTPSVLTSELVTHLNNGGKIIFLNDQGDFEIDTVKINNLTRITLVGNSSTIKRDQNNKYLFIHLNQIK